MGVRSAGQPFGSAAGGTAGAFGSGADGDATLDGVTTVLGMAPVANAYTMTRDLHFANLTIAAGVTLFAAGYRVFVDGNLGGDGVIDRSGKPAVLGAGGAGPATGGPLPGGVAGATSTTVSPGSAPAANPVPFGATAGAAAAGAATSSVGDPGNPGANGGVLQGGGGGGAGFAAFTGSAGSASGLNTVVAATKGLLQSWPACVNGRYLDGTTLGACGSGGGGGRSDGAVAGGGGGGSAGMLFVACRSWSGAVALRARGGDGAACANGGGGSGGGGAGGIVVCVTDASTAPTIDVSGGSGPAGTQGGGNIGGAGGDGGAGLSFVFSRERA